MNALRRAPPQPRQSRAPGPRAQRGAALLLALVTVVLVTTLAAAMVWQQWRSVQVEAAERARVQQSRILLGALDWLRLILREDMRSGNRTDHLEEPWATPLAEARLSTFLAGEGRANTDDAGIDAFLSGFVTDAQSRYNLRNLVDEQGQVPEAEFAVLRRLAEPAGVAPAALRTLAARLATAGPAPPPAERPATGSAAGAPRAPGLAASPPAIDANPNAVRSVAIDRVDQLSWLGADPALLAALADRVTLLPRRTPLNLNTASRDVIAAVLGVDRAIADRIVRQRPFKKDLAALAPLLPEGFKLDPLRVGLSSDFFEVTGRMRLDERVLQERSLLERRGGSQDARVIVVWRDRAGLAVTPGAPGSPG